MTMLAKRIFLLLAVSALIDNLQGKPSGGASGPVDGMSPPPGRVKSPVVQETIEEDEPEEESYELADRRVLQDRASEPPTICADDGTEVTVTAKFWYVNDFEGGQEAAEAVTKAFVDKTNEVMKNSKVSIKYQQWGTVQQHPKSESELSAIQVGVLNEKNSNDLFIWSAGDTEEDWAFLKQSADHMVLLFNSGGLCKDGGCEPNRCKGFHWEGKWWNGNPHMTIIVTGTEDNSLVFAHEAGHCVGAMHNREQTGSSDKSRINFGYCIPNSKYATVMSYTYTCPDTPDGGTPEKIPYYSNPLVSYEGHPTGDEFNNNALYMNWFKWDSMDYGTNCADGTAETKEEMTNKCQWVGDGWTDQPASQCCCEGSFYEDKEYCFLPVPGLGYSYVPANYQVQAKFKDCVNLLGEQINPHLACAVNGESFSEYASKSYIDCSSSCESGNVCPADESLDADVDGGWSEWGECSLECGGGVQYRACTNPPPSGPNGADCQGETEQACNTQDCPVAGECQSAEGKEAGSVEIPSLPPGTTVKYNFKTFKADGSPGYQNTGIKIKDYSDKYWGSPSLMYTRGSKSGSVTISEEGVGAFGYVYPYGPYDEGSAYGGTWSLELCVE